MGLGGTVVDFTVPAGVTPIAARLAAFWFLSSSVLACAP